MQHSLALLFEDPLVAIARLRRGEGAEDTRAFRAKLVETFQRIQGDAGRLGYSAQHTRVAIFAVAATIDETILASGNPQFDDWKSKPLCLQVFKTNLGGEIFFDDLRSLLEAEPTTEMADVLEVFLLCLLLGFAGKFKNNDSPQIANIIAVIRKTISRIRGEAPIAPLLWALPTEAVVPHRDKVALQLVRGAIGAAVLAMVLFAAAKLNLMSDARELRQMSAGAAVL